jgi:(S)-2-hydroxy-acid oxidase
MAYPPELSRNALAKIRSNRSDSNDHNIIDTIYNDGVGGDRDDAYQRLCFNVDDFQALAKKRLRKDLYEYLASGSDDEQTLSENRLAFKRWFLRPRVLRSVGRIRTQTVLRFGRRGSSNGWCSHPVAMPVFVSPAGVHALCDERHGECATARACSKASILFGLSQHSTRSIEEVATAASSGGSPAALNFYQAYILKDRERTLSLIRRAISAGYKGIFLTVDSVRFGYREADARNGFNALPPPHRLVNYDEPPSSEATAAAAALEKSSRRSSSLGLDQTYNSQEKKAWDQNSEQMFEQDVSWEDVRWIKNELVKRQQTNKGPLVPSSSRAS